MDYRGLVKRLQVPDGSIVPRELSYHDIRAHAISRAFPFQVAYYSNTEIPPPTRT